MRLKLVFSVREGLEIPIHYNHIVQKNIYDTLTPEYAKFLHEEGYKANGRSYKLFTFSKLVIENKTILDDKIRIEPGEVFLTVSSIDERFVFALIDGIINKRYFQFENRALKIKAVYARKELKAKKLVALTISPIVVTKGGDRKKQFYSIDDDLFTEKIKENLLRKYLAFYGENYSGELIIEILDRNRVKKVIDCYKKYPYEAYLGGFIIKGEKDIINVAYSCGLGDKNAQGFGCIEKIDEINKLDNYVRVF